MSVDEYVDQLNFSMKEIVEKLRKIINNHSSDIKEEIKWNVPTYSINRNVCSIMVHKKHVNFQIFRGAHLKDAGELAGTGKDMRHLKITTVDDVQEISVKKYLRQAIELDK